MDKFQNKTVAIIVAHPDDETLWVGGTILSQPLCNWFVVCLCRGNDIERATNFKNALIEFKAEGIMGNIDDGPEQIPLDNEIIQKTILELLPRVQYDIIITHNPTGEYTRNLRHEEISKAVISLWKTKQITTNELWTFAYEDGNKTYLPKAIITSSIHLVLPKRIWQKKYNIITETYKFSNNSWEAETTPLIEAFWKFKDSVDADKWIIKCTNSLTHTH